jgi:hypothetical protein
MQAVDQSEAQVVTLHHPPDTLDRTARMMLAHRITGLRGLLSTDLRDETQRNAVEAFLANAEACRQALEQRRLSASIAAIRRRY